MSRGALEALTLENNRQVHFSRDGTTRRKKVRVDMLRPRAKAEGSVFKADTCVAGMWSCLGLIVLLAVRVLMAVTRSARSASTGTRILSDRCGIGLPSRSAGRTGSAPRRPESTQPELGSGRPQRVLDHLRDWEQQNRGRWTLPRKDGIGLTLDSSSCPLLRRRGSWASGPRRSAGGGLVERRGASLLLKISILRSRARWGGWRDFLSLRRGISRRDRLLSSNEDRGRFAHPHHLA
jgi:hypothetical protein